jgi:hypothetical protein
MIHLVVIYNDGFTSYDDRFDCFDNGIGMISSLLVVIIIIWPERFDSLLLKSCYYVFSW